MNDFYFYKKNSERFKKYKFNSKSKFVGGEKPNFFEYLKKFASKKFKVLDLGCGSGELSIRLAPLFKEVVGIDLFPEYIQTAKKQKKQKKAENVFFKITNANKLPFANEIFDIVISSRGPLSANLIFMREGSRVLKKGGIMIEETIGEKDKLELKAIFQRGQNYPTRETKIESIKKLLKGNKIDLIEFRYYMFYQSYSLIDDIIELLERAPIIPRFDKIKDRKYVAIIKEKLKDKGMKLSSHRLHWAAKKQIL